MADAWQDIDSNEYDSHCGDLIGKTLQEGLDGTDFWGHYVNHTHWFILDMSETYTIKKFRARTSMAADPTDVDLYVSDSKLDFGVAVATGINTWQDSDAWVEVDSTDKDGRYIKVVINSTEGVPVAGYVAWGNAPVPYKIIDVYGDVGGAPPPPSNKKIPNYFNSDFVPCDS